MTRPSHLPLLPRISLILINSTETSRHCTVQIGSDEAKVLESVVSDQQQAFATLPVSASASFSLPAQSVATLVCEVE